MKYYLLCLIGWCCCVFGAHAQFIGTPELVGYYNASYNFCQGFGLQIKFDAGGMNAGNIMTVQLSDSVGSFARPVVVGSMAVGNGQNMFINFIIPANTAPGPTIPTVTRGYKIRLVSSSPVITSQVNQFAFKVLRTLQITNPQPARYGVNQWVAHVYTWQTVLPLVNNLVNPAIQDFFNPTNYKGYFTKTDLSFDFDWDRGPIPAGNNARIDSNQVSCEYRESFAIRFRRRENLPLGYYAFQYGADDGIRISTDGGATWLYDSWREQQFAQIIPGNGCGIVLGGQVDLVVEYFQRLIQSRVMFNMIRTGDPNQLPAFAPGQDGNAYCTSAPPFQLVATPPGGQFSGAGVSPSGLFNPRIAGLGARNIFYTTGGLGTCQKRDTIRLTVNSGSDGRFIGLDSAYCLSNAVAQLQSLQSGVFSGPGVTGTTFSVASAGVGIHTVTHIVNTIAACPDTVRQTVRVYAPAPSITFSLPRTTICANETPIQASYSAVTGGVFSGRGISATGVFNPAGLNGTYRLVYKVRSGPCADSIIQSITVNAAPRGAFTGLDTAYCAGAGPVTLVGNQPTGYFVGAGLNGTRFSPSVLAAGQYLIQYIVPGPCPDTVKKTVQVRSALNPSFVGFPASICPINPPIVLSALPVGGVFKGQGLSTSGGLTTFNPAGLSGSITITYVVRNGTCADSATASIGISATPNLLLLTDSVICIGGGPYSLRAAQAGGTWSGTAVTGDQFNPNVAGIGRHTITYNLSQGSCGGTATTTIRVAGISNILFNKNTTSCYNEPIALSISSTPSTPFAVLIKDQAGNTVGSGTNTTDFTGLRLEQSSNLTFVLTELGTNCQYTYQDATGPSPDPTAPSYTAVALGLAPAFKIDTLNNPPNYPLQVRLTNLTRALATNGTTTLPLPPSATVRYQINWGDGTATEESIDLSSVEHIYYAETAANNPYTVTFKVNDNAATGFASCLYQSSQTVSVRQDTWPNVITPNGDNLNDQLIFDGMAGRGKLQVYNRLGVRVFEEELLTNTWAGQSVPSGTYFYTMVDARGSVYKGWVDVLK